MTVDDLLPRLDAVCRSSRGYVARCPAHADKSPSLAIKEGERGLLIKCWAGCTLDQITAAIGIQVSDLFFDAVDTRTAYQSRIQRTQERQWQTLRNEVDGFSIDALREADTFIRSRRGLDISTWSHALLNSELDAVADAYHLLENEDFHGCSR